MCRETSEFMCEQLRARKLLVAAEEYPHVYPHCWRTGEELAFRLVDEWFINMDWRDEIKDAAQSVQWLPTEMKGEDREVEWLSNMHDWMISKKRFWGLALPIWVDDETGDFEVIGSLQELEERAVEGWEHVAQNSPHRPWIDRVKIRNPKSGNLMSRVEDVGNPWLDAGIVPFSTLQYRQDRSHWEEWFPADLVTECFPGQFRNWFYSLLSMSTMLEGQAPFKTLLGHRLVLNEVGKPMHKSDGSAIWFEEAAEQLGVDVMRWMYLAQNPCQDLRFGKRDAEQPVELRTPEGTIAKTMEGATTCKVTSKTADEVRRRLIIPVWSCFKFFLDYAVADGFTHESAPIPVEERSELDRWILSRFQVAVEGVRQEMTDYRPHRACEQVESFVDDLSNWYIRRSRRRFWREMKPGDQDKLAAYQTLYFVLAELAKLTAPMIPFLSERIYQTLVAEVDSTAPESVHLCKLPTPNKEMLDEGPNRRMANVLDVVRAGHKLRKIQKLRVRQPVAELRIGSASDEVRASITALADVVADELNVKQVSTYPSLDGLLQFSVKPDMTQIGPRAGKDAGTIAKTIAKWSRATIDRLRNGHSMRVPLENGEFEITLDELKVSTSTVDGWAVEKTSEIQVALDTRISEHLIREGIARDFVRQVQQLRKEEGLAFRDQIRIQFSHDNRRIARAVRAWRTFIEEETQAVDVCVGAEIPSDAKSVAVGGETISVWFQTS